MIRILLGVFMTSVLLNSGCRSKKYDSYDDEEHFIWENPRDNTEDGIGGSYGLTFPFPSGEYWNVTQTYNTGSHRDYNFSYGDDSFAIDFSQSGCEAYGKPITPILEGQVMKVTTEGNGDSGYGNSVLIEHDGGYVSRYAHFSENLVGEGQYVSTNDYIGRVGDSGYVIGSACSSHPGTHLHLAFYSDGNAIAPEPLSGVSPVTTGCWYNREGDESCGSNPGSYDSDDPVDNSDVDDEGELDIVTMEISPEQGTAGETEYIWIAVVVSPDAKPDATLEIRNPTDGVTYDFNMTTENSSNPYVFTYRKTLRDASTYSYWVESSNGDGNDTSEVESVRVDDSINSDFPSIYRFTYTPVSGSADSTEFTWDAKILSYNYPNAELVIVNPNDGVLYRFDMDVDGNSYYWTGEYEKRLRDASTYPFWVEVSDDDGAHTSEVGHIRVSE